MAFEIEGFCVVRGPDAIWGGDIRSFHPPLGEFDGIIGGPPCQTFSWLAHLVRANGHEPKFGNLIPEFERCVAEAHPHWFLMENVPAAPEPVVKGYGVTSFLLDNSMLDSGNGWGEEQRRVRRFSFGLATGTAPDLRRWIDMAVFVLPDAERAVTALGPAHLDGLARSTQKFRRTAVNAGHDDPSISLTEKRRRRKQAVLSSTREIPVKIGGSGKVKRTAVTSSDGGGRVRMNKYRLADALRLQGLPKDFLDHCPFTAEGKLKAVANGVALPTGRAIARAIKVAMGKGKCRALSR